MADGSNPLRAAENDRSVVLEKQDPNPEAAAPQMERGSTAGVAPDIPAPRRQKTSRTRQLLFALLPVAVLAGGYFYVTGGQVMTTDNAYVQADMVGISTDVSGIVQSVEVRDNQQVRRGDVLFRLDAAPFAIALEGAEAQLGVVRNQILNLEASYRQAQAEITQAQADIPFFEKTLQRQHDLTASAAASKAVYDQAKHDLDAAQQKVDVARAEAAAILAQLGNQADGPVEQNPSFLAAKAAVDNARRNLDHTVVRAPFDGIVTNVSALQVGSYLQAAQSGFSLVSTTHMWIAASPKETELTHVREGQKVTITVDTYPGESWSGTVASISPASGSSFSLLPAQNTTGNWVKVVQRIPMLVSIENMEGKPPLRMGMSVEIGVDTAHARGLPSFLQDLFGSRHG